MLEFRKEEKRVVLVYTGEIQESSWIYTELEQNGSVTLRRTFTVTRKELISEKNPEDEDAAVEFEIATRVGEYYKFHKSVFRMENDLFIHKDIELTNKTFIAERNISIFSKLDHLVKEPIYIGGSEPNSIPKDAFIDLLRKFPNSYELTRYASARIDAVISSYLETKENYEEKYQKYMNRKATRIGDNLYKMVAAAEIAKYKSVLSKLTDMLDNEVSYSEKQWQKEILQVILLLYPKYIYVFEEAPVWDSYSQKNRSIDLILVDASGNIDIIEIKKPFDKCIVTHRTYRDNYIPLRELSGTVMQIEKYIFYLNKWGKKGEDKLTSYYRDKLADGFRIKITNPGAIIIMGRENELSDEQRQDFEVIRRKYKHVIDIITYDDLLRRIDSMVKHWSRFT